MADVKWIKLDTDLFNNRKIKQIEALPDGDAIIVIWLKLLTIAGKTNANGQIFFTEEIPYTEQMLATEFNKPLATVQMAMSVFAKFGMIEIIDDIICLPSWANYQNVEGLDRVREQGRIRQQRYRERQKALPTTADDKPTQKAKDDLFADVPEELKDAFKEWADMRKRIKKPITSKATVTRNLNALYKLSKRTDKQIAIINQSIDNCWAGFWELKNDKNDKPPAQKVVTFDDDGNKDYVGLPDDIRAKMGGLFSL